MDSSVTVREVTHHGNYRKERVVSLPSGLTRLAVKHLIAGGPYCYPDRHVPNVLRSLSDTGTAEVGWTTWTVDNSATPTHPLTEPEATLTATEVARMWGAR